MLPLIRQSVQKRGDERLRYVAPGRLRNLPSLRTQVTDEVAAATAWYAVAFASDPWCGAVARAPSNCDGRLIRSRSESAVKRTPGCWSLDGHQNTRLSLFETVKASQASNWPTRGLTRATARAFNRTRAGMPPEGAVTSNSNHRTGTPRWKASIAIRDWVERTPRPGRSPVRDARVDLGRSHVGVPEELLKGTGVVPVLE
jgi:hypothetical protein